MNEARWIRTVAVESADLTKVRRATLRAQARAGRESEARTRLEQVESSGRHLSAYFLAQSWLALGDLERAGRYLLKAADDHEWYLIFVRVDPAMDELRGHRAYTEVVDRLAF